MRGVARRGLWALFALFAATSGSARAGEADVAVSTRPAVESHARNGESPLDGAAEVLGTGKTFGRAEVLVRARHEGFTAATSLRLANDGRHVEGTLEVNELFYDFALLGEHFTAGKKVTSWDVGFAFRPLDVVQREDRRALNPLWLDGVPQLAWEHFGEIAALSVVWANPLAGTGARVRDDEAVSAKLYLRLPVVDVHLLGRYSERDRLGAGIGFSAVFGEGLELHGSGLWQRRYGKLHDPLAGDPGATLATADPVVVTAHHDGVAAVVGGSYTLGVGVSLLVEAFHDPSGGSAAEWRDVRTLAQRQHALLGGAAPSDAVRGNLAWTAGMLDRPSLLADNVVARLSYRDEELDPALDVLFSPADPGFVVSATLGYQTTAIRLELGGRYSGGPARSVFRLLPEQGIVYASCKISL